jgi:hypothetical protein
MAVRRPDGSRIDVPRHADGKHGDLLPNDGVYGGTVDADEVGNFLAEAVFEGQGASGVRFVRTSQHVLPVMPDTISFKGSATMLPTKHVERVEIIVDIDQHETVHQLDESYRIYGELWGKSATDGSDVPICWLSNVDNIHIAPTDKSLTITLNLALQWIARSGAVQPFTLKNVWMKGRFHSEEKENVKGKRTSTHCDMFLYLCCRHGQPRSSRHHRFD